jgi:hypothetical protein
MDEIWMKSVTRHGPEQPKLDLALFVTTRVHPKLVYCAVLRFAMPRGAPE